MSEDKPRVLILGGLGFIGRNLVKYLCDQNCCSLIRVVDKAVRSSAHLGKIHSDAFNKSIVKFKNANLLNPGNPQFLFIFSAFSILLKVKVIMGGKMAAKSSFSRSKTFVSQQIDRLILLSQRFRITRKVFQTERRPKVRLCH
jgi:nucleoside-diphosphate-sugar epimerase